MVNNKSNELENLNIKTLRVMAAQIGVKAPTSKSKEVLITAIRDVLENRVEPHFPNRPTVESVKGKMMNMNSIPNNKE